MLSVVLCTFNGSRYLDAQLQSILEQTRLPDEVIACDDCSIDDTVEILNRFASKVPFPVRVTMNAENLRTSRNFQQGIEQAHGDVIVLADQDDVWQPEKLDRLERTLLDSPEAGFVFSDATVVDSELRPRGFTLWESIVFDRREHQLFRRGRAFECILRKYRVTGATMAFRSRYRDLILPIPVQWVHDAWISLLLSAVAPCCLIEEPLIRYRQHGNQQIGTTKPGLYWRYLRAREMSQASCFQAIADNFAMAHERLRGVPGIAPQRLAGLVEKSRHWRIRAEMRERGWWRFPIILREAWRGNYARYASGWKSMALDLFLG
jgi:glycosyltransferase involved in cell wall biosynthesis